MHDNSFYFLSFHLLILSGEVLFIIALLHAIYQRRSPQSTIGWLLAIFLLPYIAVPFYFLVSTRKRRSTHKKSKFHLHDAINRTSVTSNPIEEILRNNSIPKATVDNRTELYFDGVSAFQALIKEIKSCTTSIYISTYVLKIDAVGIELLKVLTIKARAGIRVRLLIDSLGSFQLYFTQFPLKALRQAGGEVQFFMPLLRMPFRNYINLRNHRKIYLFDHRIVLTGGMNLGKKYMGPVIEKKRWKDLLFLAEGSAVSYYNEIFAHDWAYANSTKPESPPLIGNKAGNTYLQVVPSGPDIKGDPLYEALLSAIHACKKRIWIVTPYFVPDASLMTALIIAQHKGIDVKLITPRQSDHMIADLGRSSFMRDLDEQGVHLALYEGQMLHAKAILFDDFGAMLGSVNIDNRSLFLNYEVVSFAYSPAIIKELETWMQELLQRSTGNIAPPTKLRRLAENVMRIIAPEL
jgi:cardiolipin synthase A/B